MKEKLIDLIAQAAIEGRKERITVAMVLKWVKDKT